MDIIAKTRADYNQIAAHFAATRRGQESIRELAKFAPFIQRGARILDWGCGNGRLLNLLKGKSVSYYGVDQSLELLKIARRDWRAAIKAGRAHFFCTARRDKKFPVGFFDLVFAIASLHHLPDVKSRCAVLRKFFTALKPGARLIITVWNLDSDWARAKYRMVRQKLAAHDYLIPWKNQQGELMAWRYYHHFTQSELRRLLVQSGFKVTEMYYSLGNQRVAKRQARNLVAVASK
ncbi:MAG: class I SAM-dependent methyltransferase [Candidatus Magasanikbacteria bacterium]|nr:class I SAM-dependent methyltransferase [Candidatus Magasanikbacteria bacterium]